MKGTETYIESAEKELEHADNPSNHPDACAYHLRRAQVFATLAVARSTAIIGDK
jgi:hypothetical protein